MKKNKITLSEEIVKYIFPGANPAVALGEDGYIIYDFERLFPPELGVFVPIEVNRSNYNAIFPKPFDSYFVDIYDELSYLSRLLEVPITPALPAFGAECIPGSVMARNVEEGHVIFRFDELIEQREKTSLLCRVEAERLHGDDEEKIARVCSNLITSVDDIGGNQYLYWVMPISLLFQNPGDVLSAAFAYAWSLNKK